MTIHLLKNKTEDGEVGRKDPYEQHLEDSRFIPILSYVPVDFDNLVEQLKSPDFDSVIVTSQRAVDVLKQALDGIEDNTILKKPAYTVGPATAERLKLAGFETVYGAHTGNGHILATEMVETLENPSRFLFLAGEVHRKELPTRLRDANHEVETVVVYRTEPIEFVNDLKTSLQEDDWIVFFSPSFTDEIMGVLKEQNKRKRIRIAAIGPTTRDHLKENGIEVHAMAEKPSAESLAKAIQSAEP